MSKKRLSKPLLRAAALTASALLTSCGSTGGTVPLPGNPKGSHADQQAEDVLLSGTIEAVGVAAVGEALFISIRGPAGPPLAAKKLPVGPFPMSFEITKADLIPMGGERPVPDTLQVKVVIDGDGDPLTQEGLASYHGSQPRGTTGVVFALTRPIPPPGNPKGSHYDRPPAPVEAPPEKSPTPPEE